MKQKVSIFGVNMWSWAGLASCKAAIQGASRDLLHAIVTKLYSGMGLCHMREAFLKICTYTYRLAEALSEFLQHQKKNKEGSYCLFMLFLQLIEGAVARPSAKIAFISGYSY